MTNETVTTAGPGDAGEPPGGVFGGPYRVLTLGLVGSVTTVAFLWLGVTTVMPRIAADLGGLGLYGWAFTGFMLANMVAAALVGPWADRSGAVRPLLVAVAVFLAGCAISAAAPNWPVFLAGRSAQGFGVGGVLTIVYLAVGRMYPDHLRARMLAIVASCWTLPALAGPVLLGALADAIGWRAVFVVFVPLTAVAVVPALPGLRGPGSGGRVGGRQLLATLGLAAGVGALLVGLESRRTAVLVALVVVGLGIVVPALRALMPAGFLTARRGLPSAVLGRGLVSAAYYGTEAFFPLAMTTAFAFSTTGSGLALAAGSVSWVAGAWAQARFDARGGDTGRRRRVVAGFVLLLVGLAGLAWSLAVPTGYGAAVAVAGWGLGGLGMGLVYPSVTTLALAQTPDARKGATSGSLQLAETLSAALVAGLSGTLVAHAETAGQDARTGLATVFTLTSAAALAGIAVAVRTLARESRARERPDAPRDQGM